MTMIQVNPLDVPCPRCSAAAGTPCDYGKGNPSRDRGKIHKPRIEKAEFHAIGPTIDDVVLGFERKYRVTSTESDGRVMLRSSWYKRPNAWIERVDLDYDPIAGAWRYTGALTVSPHRVDEAPSAPPPIGIWHADDDEAAE